MQDQIQTVLIYALPVLFAITLHEAAHGYMALRLGDKTAWLQGRITLNPMNHIDPIGTIVMPLALYFLTSGNFIFGFAKPVPVVFGNLRHPKRDMVWVALAGPAANFFQALLWAIAALSMSLLGIEERFFLEMAQAGILANLVMFAFNLFPLPPLDGGRIVMGVLPLRAAYAFSRIEPWGFYIVMGLVVMKVVGEWWMRPVIRATAALIQLLIQALLLILQALF